MSRKPARLRVEPLDPRIVPAVQFPAGSNVIDVAAVYGAVPDDGLDDTAAVQRAVNFYMANDAVLYFRDGVYDFSGPIDYSLAGRSERGLWLQGESEEGTVFRWGANLPVFNQVGGNGLPVNVPALDLYNGNSGNAFGNYLHDLTVEIGPGNPGAVGVQYHSNNYGSIRNLTIRSLDPAGVGAVGLDMAIPEPGPWLAKGLTIEGFDTGITAAPQSYSAVFEGLHLEGQRVAGFTNYRLPVSITNFTSVNAVPAYIQVSSFGWGNTVITDAVFAGGDPGRYAVVNENNNPANGQGNAGLVFLRNARAEGYAGVLDDQVAGRRPAGPVAEYVSYGVHTLTPEAPATSLNLPVEPTPPTPDVPLDRWASVIDFGANPWDDRDDAPAVQRALDSGARVVYFPTPVRTLPDGRLDRGVYRVGQSLTVGGAVERVAGLYSTVAVVAPLWGQDAPLFRVVDGPRDAVQIDGFVGGSEGGFGGAWHAFGHDTTDTLVIKDGAITGYRNAVRGGKVFVENWTGSDLRFSGQKVWLRQTNPEETVDRPKLVNDGGDLWVLGLKTEGRSTQIDTRNGGRTEVLGGQLYHAAYIPTDYPAFTVTDGSLSFTLAESNYIYRGAHDLWVRDTRGGAVRELTRSNAPIDGARLGAANFGLYTGRIVDATPPAAPANLRTTARTTSAVTLAWDQAAEAQSFVRAYRVYRDGVFIGATAGAVTTFTDAGRPDGTAAAYRVVAENAAGLTGPSSRSLVAATLADAVQPELLRAVAIPYAGTELVLTFSKPMDPDRAADPAYYEVSDGVEVVAAVPSADGLTVRLTTSPLAPGTGYTVAVAGLTDRATAPNPVAPWTAAAFTYRDAAAGTGLTAAYYPSNNFTGTPVVQVDRTVDFDWGGGTPGVPGIGADLFSVRWTGQVEPRYTEEYTFTMVGDDRLRLVVDGRTLIDRGFYSPDEFTGSIRLEAGRRYDIEVTVAEDFGGAGARLWWQSARQPREIVPAAQLFPARQYETVTVRTSAGRGADAGYQIIDGGLLAEYFPNPTFSGPPAVSRFEGAINHFWQGSPFDGLPADNFSVRWTGFVLPNFSEDYVFSALPDDSFRVWVNDVLVLDRPTWSPTEVQSAPVRLTAGVPARIRVEVVETGGPGTAVLLWESPSTVKNYPNVLRPEFPDTGTSDTLVTYNRLNLSFFQEFIGLRFDLSGVDLAANRVVDADLSATLGPFVGDEVALITVDGTAESVPNQLWAETGPDRVRWATFPGNQGGNYSFGGPGVSTHLGYLEMDNRNFRANAAGRDALQLSSDGLTRFVQADTDGLLTVMMRRTVPNFFGNINIRTKEYDDGSFAPGLRLTLAPRVTPAPAGVDLLPASDTGPGDADDRTARNNGSPAAALRFAVTGTTPGAVVTLYADGVAVGSAVADGPVTEVLTRGTRRLADGLRSVTARQTVLGQESADSPALGVTVDTAAPRASLASVWPNPRATPVATLGVSFTEPVAGFDPSDLLLTLDGVPVDLSGVTVAGGPSAYTVGGLAGPTARDGAYALSVLPGGVTDLAGNPLAVGTVRTWAVADEVAPRVLSVRRLDPNPTAAGAVRYAVTFSEAVTGVDPADFALTTGPGVTGAEVQGVAGSGAVYTVTVGTGAGSGTLRLDVPEGAVVADVNGNDLDGSFARGDSYTLDRTGPTVRSAGSVSPNPRRTPVDSLTVSYSEAVAAATVDVADFALTRNGVAVPLDGVTLVRTGPTTVRVDGLTPLTGASGVYTFTAAGGGVTDLLGNPGTGSASRTWTREVPRVLSVARASASPTNAPAVDFTVTFSEPVTGVDPADFRAVMGTGLTGAGVQGVAGSGAVYTVTVGTGSGSGTLRLDFAAAGSGVTDAFANPVTADFTRGHVTTVDRTPPALRSIAGVGATTAEAVGTLTVTFTEAIDPATFTRARLRLTRDGGPDLIDAGVTITRVSDTVYVVGGLGPLTADLGSYLFAVDLDGILDRAGNGGAGVRTRGWVRV